MQVFCLKFYIQVNFVQKKIIFSRNFVQNWFRIDTKLMRNFVQKLETLVKENLLFRGNPKFLFQFKLVLTATAEGKNYFLFV